MNEAPRPSRSLRACHPSGATIKELLLALAVAVALTWIFFGPLWEGGSLIGGDLFPYFFPQKAFLAEQLQQGVIPLWNPLTGHGYPTIAESQTGVCYPPDLLAYRVLSVTTAYNVVQLVHYVVAFLGTWLLARALGASASGALIAGLSFVYGWCAPRICLEWAVVTGAYVPWVLWCAESYLQRPRLRFLLALCCLLALQLLAGHFHLAFITQLLLAIYAPLRWRLALLPEEARSASEGLDSRPLAPAPGERGRGEGGSASQRGQFFRTVFSLIIESFHKMKPRDRSPPHPNPLPRGGGEGTKPKKTNAERPIPNASWLMIWAAVPVAFLLAAVQLAPTWELKQRSQRSEVSGEHQPGYGHLPPRYWSQVVLPWVWYAGDIDATLTKLPNYAGGAGTNRVEAHLYFGLIPLALAVGGLFASWRSRAKSDRVLRLWMALGLLFLLYTPGWLLPVTQYLPGFNFFRGPGRYGIVTSLAIALVAGATFSRLCLRFADLLRIIVTLLVLAVTTAELWWVALTVGYSQLLSSPIVERRLDSPIRQLLAKESQPVRLFAPMANVANLLDVSSTPVYLGIGPATYFDPQFTMPVGPQGGLDLAGNPDQIRWLQQAGVTHIFSLERLNAKHWPVELKWTGVDPFLHSAFGRPSHEPISLYRLRASRGRIAWEEPIDVESSVEITGYAAHRITARCESTSGGKIILTDLAYPGWQVAIDGQQVPPESSGMFRAATVPAGQHDIVWTYRPASVSWGTVISAAALLGLLSASVVHSRRRKDALTL